MRILLAASLLFVAAVAGCAQGSSEGDDELLVDTVVWVEEGIAHQDVIIDLGYRSGREDRGAWVEPVARITRGGSPAADALVFVALVSFTGSEEDAKEAATVYDFSPQRDAAHYAGARLTPPSGAPQCTLRYRIVLPDGRQGWTGEVTASIP